MLPDREIDELPAVGHRREIDGMERNHPPPSHPDEVDRLLRCGRLGVAADDQRTFCREAEGSCASNAAAAARDDANLVLKPSSHGMCALQMREVGGKPPGADRSGPPGTAGRGQVRGIPGITNAACRRGDGALCQRWSIHVPLPGANLFKASTQQCHLEPPIVMNGVLVIARDSDHCNLFVGPARD